MAATWPSKLGHGTLALVSALLLLVCLVGCGRVTEQTPPAEPPRSVVEAGPVRLSVEFQPARVALADRAALALTIDHEPGVTLEPPEFGEQFGDFRVVDSRDELPRVEGDREVVRWVLTLEPIRAGSAAIWPVDVAFVDARPGGDGKRHIISSTPLRVEVATEIKADSPSLAELRPGAKPVAVPFSPVGTVVAAVAILAAAGVAAYLARRHRQRQWVESQRPLTPAEIAYIELQQIIDERLADRDIKLFYVAVTGVVRRFVERTTSIRAPEQTTEEFLHEISVRHTFPPEENRRLASFLEAADLVKFAAHRPGQEDVDATLARAREFIDARRDAMAAESAATHAGETASREVA